MSKVIFDTNALSLLLRHGFMPLKKVQEVVPDLTYRKLNNWDAEHIITFDRVDLGVGWRKFGYIDTVILRITSDLRKFNVGMKEIKQIIESIESILEKRIIDSVETYASEKTFLVIDDNLKGEFRTKSEIMTTHFSFDHPTAPLLILPFTDYLDQVFQVTRFSYTDHSSNPAKEKQNMAETIQGMTEIISAKEKKILELIRKDLYHTVTIRKKDGSFTVNAKSTKKGSITKDDILKSIRTGGYRNVTLTTQDGKSVSIIDDETFKI